MKSLLIFAISFSAFVALLLLLDRALFNLQGLSFFFGG